MHLILDSWALEPFLKMLCVTPGVHWKATAKCNFFSAILGLGSHTVITSDTSQCPAPEAQCKILKSGQGKVTFPEHFLELIITGTDLNSK